MIETTTLTVAAGFLAVETDAACRAVLATIWPDLDWFNLDLTTLGQTPEQVAPWPRCSDTATGPCFAAA